jgi:hypothetical protein
MRFFRLAAIAVLLLACAVLGSACAGAKGEQGPKGDAGANGVGVQNVVSNGNGTFTVNLTNGTAYTTDNFIGPRGLQGEQGPQGVQGVQGLQGTPGIGVEWVGPWDSSTLYGRYDAVGYQGSSYISRQPNNTNHLPTDTNWWDLWVEKGDTGDQGGQGVQGPVGPNMIVAAGVIFYDGTVKQGYNITSCSWDASGSRYLIQLNGITFDYAAVLHYVVLVTPTAYIGIEATYNGTAEGLLQIALAKGDADGDVVLADTFSFMVLDPTP